MFQIDNQFDLPKDVMYGELLGQIVGRNRLIIENYKRLLLFLPNEIKIQCCRDFITITGKQLKISYFNQETIMIEGEIGEISFL